MQIRIATIKDLPSIRTIAQQTWPHTFSDILSPAQIDYMLEMMYSITSLQQQMEQQHVFLIANDNGIDEGYLSYELNYHDAPLVKVHKIYLLPSAQGKGMGRQLLEAAEQAGRAAKQTTITLNVNKYNKALAFYQHLGFVITGYEDIDIGNGYLMEDAVLVKKLQVDFV